MCLTDPQVLKMEKSKRETGERIHNFDASFPDGAGNETIYDRCAGPLVEVRVCPIDGHDLLLLHITTDRSELTT